MVNSVLLILPLVCGAPWGCPSTLDPARLIPATLPAYVEVLDPSLHLKQLQQNDALSPLREELPESARRVIKLASEAGVSRAALGFDHSFLRDKTTFVLLLEGGDKDTLLNWPDEQQPVYEALSAPKAAALLADAGHYAFSDICEVAPFFDDCGGPEEGWIPIEDAHAITQHTVTAWLDVHLAGQADQAVYLEETELSAFPELTWMEE